MSLFDLIVVQPIFNLLVLIYSIIPGADFGLALIVVTIIIRLLMWPLVKKQLHQVKAMRKIQPELKRIKKSAKGNKQVEGMQMLELYKKHGINPFRSIGILLIQLPIFISLYRVIQIFTINRGDIAKYSYDFLENIPALKLIIDHPDQFNEKFLGFIDLTQHAVSPEGVSFVLIILALVASFTQLIISKQTMPQDGGSKRLRDILAEAGEGKEPDQAEMNAVMMRKMTKFLPVMMFLIMINLPAALALYYAVSNMIAAAQQFYILKQGDDEPSSQATIREKTAKEAQVVKSPTKSPTKSNSKKKSTSNNKPTSDTTITRILAKDNRPRNKKS